MKIAPLIAIVVVIGIVAALGARGTITGLFTKGDTPLDADSENSLESNENQDSDPSDSPLNDVETIFVPYNPPVEEEEPKRSGGSGSPNTPTPPSDTTAPVITLMGNETQIIEINEPYVELGANATDNKDGDLTANITIDNSSVDTSIAGNYTVIYSVSDAAGNTAEANRTIMVLEEVCDFIDNDMDGEIDEIGCANIYGIVSDADTGLPIEGANISFYSKSVYDVYYDSGDYSLLVPKETPDAVTDATGLYNVSILEGDYHIVIQSSNEKDFNVKANKSQGSLKHDVEIDEDRGNHDFNAEGHILYSGEYEYNDENLYACGDVMKFMMFGVNNGIEDETITFVVQDHSSDGSPGAPIVYEGNLSNPDESLIVPAGTKTHKVFEFQIPCSYNTGKHDIHVIWDNEKFHKIGNFFIMPDTTNPWINTALNVAGLPNESITVGYASDDPAEPGSIRSRSLSITIPLADDSLTINIDEDITVDSDSDGAPDNDIDYTTIGGDGDYNLTYGASGSYTARFTVLDGSGNSDFEDVSVIVYISEAEADAIAQVIYNEILGMSMSSWTGEIFGITRTWDRWDDGAMIGDEYLTEEGDLTQMEIDMYNENIDRCGGQPYMRVIEPTTAQDYNNTLTDFLNHILAC
jgi:hypothetical protein